MSRAKKNWERKWYPLTIAQTAKCYAGFVYCCFYVAMVFLNGFCVCLFFCLVNVVSEMSSFSVVFFFFNLCNFSVFGTSRTPYYDVL